MHVAVTDWSNLTMRVSSKSWQLFRCPRNSLFYFKPNVYCDCHRSPPLDSTLIHYDPDSAFTYVYVSYHQYFLPTSADVSSHFRRTDLNFICISHYSYAQYRTSPYLILRHVCIPYLLARPVWKFVKRKNYSPFYCIIYGEDIAANTKLRYLLRVLGSGNGSHEMPIFGPRALHSKWYSGRPTILCQ